MNKKIRSIVALSLFSIGCHNLEEKLREFGPKEPYCVNNPEDKFCKEEKERIAILHDPYFLTQKLPESCKKPDFLLDGGNIYITCLNYDNSYSIYSIIREKDELYLLKSFIMN